MCITFCLVYHASQARDPLVYEHPRCKVAVFSCLAISLISSLLTLLIYSYLNGNLWDVYPVSSSVLVHAQIYLLLLILVSFVVIFLSALFFRFFTGVLIATTIISVASPVLSLVFVVHLFYKFHVFYLVASKLTCEVSILFFYFYQGFEKLINDEVEREDDARWQ